MCSYLLTVLGIDRVHNLAKMLRPSVFGHSRTGSSAAARQDAVTPARTSAQAARQASGTTR